LLPGQGFGKLKKTIVLERKLPAAVKLPGNAFDVRVSAEKPQDPCEKLAADKLQSMVEITTVVRTRIKALKVAVILDTCHSQGALAEHIKEGTGRVILAASRTEESSYELPKYSHGLFTYYLLEGLRQQKDAPLDRIYQWVAAQVAREAEANGWKQHPVFGSSDETSPVVLGIAPLDAVGWLRPGASFYAGALR